jgi:Ni/Co efflux regulator RcnB
MKRLFLASLATLAFAAPLAVTEASAHDRRGGYDRHDRHDWRDDRRAYREGFRDGRRYDHYRHNGYYLGRSWYYGPPPPAYYHRHDFRPDYRAWRRGDRLPTYYRTHYVPVDYRYHRLAPPPRGAHWVRDNRGDYLLVGIATGVILGLALAH